MREIEKYRITDQVKNSSYKTTKRPTFGKRLTLGLFRRLI